MLPVNSACHGTSKSGSGCRFLLKFVLVRPALGCVIATEGPNWVDNGPDYR